MVSGQLLIIFKSLGCREESRVVVDVVSLLPMYPLTWLSTWCADGYWKMERRRTGPF